MPFLMLQVTHDTVELNLSTRCESIVIIENKIVMSFEIQLYPSFSDYFCRFCICLYIFVSSAVG